MSMCPESTNYTLSSPCLFGQCECVRERNSCSSSGLVLFYNESVGLHRNIFIYFVLYTHKLHKLFHYEAYCCLSVCQT
jgi:hypothetical protein